MSRESATQDTVVGHIVIEHVLACYDDAVDAGGADKSIVNAHHLRRNLVIAVGEEDGLFEHRTNIGYRGIRHNPVSQLVGVGKAFPVFRLDSEFGVKIAAQAIDERLEAVIDR